MEPLLFLLVGVLTLSWVAAPIIAILAWRKAAVAQQRAEEAINESLRLRRDLAGAERPAAKSAPRRAKSASAIDSLIAAAPEPAPIPETPPPASSPPVSPTAEPKTESLATDLARAKVVTATPPPLPATPTPAPVPVAPTCESVAAAPEEMPIFANPGAKPGAKPEATDTDSAFDWENFIGAKLFAWFGGFTAFIAVTYGVRWSIQHAIIPPSVRAALCFLFGVGLLVGGVWFSRDKKFAVLRDSLCGAGTVSLYAVTFACRAIWKFEFFGQIEAFAIMSLVTATAFALAARLRAPVIAVLGIAGGFLTPILLSTGEDNPYGLFGYTAMLNLGLLAVALRLRRPSLAVLGAIGTVLMELGWATRFLDRSPYENLPGAWIPIGIVLSQFALFLVATRRAAQSGEGSSMLAHAALATAIPGTIFGMYFLNPNSPADPGITQLVAVPTILFGFLLLLEAGVFAIGLYERAARWAGPVAGVIVYLFLGSWLSSRLNHDNLYSGLGLIFAFALIHLAAPLVARRLGKLDAPPAWTQAVAPMALLLGLLPVFRFDECPLAVWPLLFVLDLAAIVVAALTRRIVPLAIMLLLTLIAAGGALLGVPTHLTGLGANLLMLVLGTLLFAGTGLWLSRRLLASADSENASETEFARAIPALAAALPFLLLVVVALRLPLADPSPIFGVATLLGVLLLGLSRILKTEALAPVALLLTALVEYAWHANHFRPESAGVPLAWYLGFGALYFAFPFVFHREQTGRTLPRIAAALAPALAFWPVYRAITTAWPTEIPGVIPALFALPAFAGLAFIAKRSPEDDPARLTALAWFGAVALGFVTLIFPIQFENQWLTLAWALEGAALVWLFRRVPHPGLPRVALVLLAVAFARLALNPAVLGYHARAEWPILNWYLYAYGTVAAALAFAARRLDDPAAGWGGLPWRGLLHGACGVLLFLLLNLEIADYFSAPSGLVRIEFSGNFARDMTYAIAWTVFAVALLILGLARGLRAPRYAAVALLAVTLVKLFTHDLEHLNELYRVGALLGVAAGALGMSFLYQKFLAKK